MKRIIAIFAVALTLAGCAAFNKSVFEGGASLTATIQNPVTIEMQVAAEGTYNLIGGGAVKYSRLPRCHKVKPGTLCSEWTVVEQFKRYDGIIYKQLQDLREFMDANDQVSAIAVYNALMKSLKDYRATAYINGAIK